MKAYDANLILEKNNASTKLQVVTDTKSAVVSAEAAEAAATAEVTTAKAEVKTAQAVLTAAKKAKPLDQPKVDAALAAVAAA